MTVGPDDATGGTEDTPTVFVVDDDPAMCAALASAAASVSLAVEVCHDGAAALAVVDARRPGCLVLDMRLPDTDGFTLLAALRARGVRLPVIILTGYADVAMAVKALRAGVFDFFEKPTSAHALLERLQAAVAHDAEERVGADRLLDFASRVSRLTAREREVLDMVIAGHSSRYIAAALALSPKTVETHRAKLMVKTGAHSLAELIRLGLQVRLERGRLADIPTAAYATKPQGGSRR
jgi:two-component system response regulator FixJ